MQSWIDLISRLLEWAVENAVIEGYVVAETPPYVLYAGGYVFALDDRAEVLHLVLHRTEESIRSAPGHRSE